MSERGHGAHMGRGRGTPARGRGAVFLSSPAFYSGHDSRGRSRQNAEYGRLRFPDNENQDSVSSPPLQGQDNTTDPDTSAKSKDKPKAFLDSFHTKKRDPRQVPSSASYMPEFGRLSPPRDISPEPAETLAKQESPGLVARDDESSLELDVKVDRSSSPTDIRVTANLSLALSFNVDKLPREMDEKTAQELKDVVWEKLQAILGDGRTRQGHSDVRENWNWN